MTGHAGLLQTVLSLNHRSLVIFGLWGGLNAHGGEHHVP